MNAGLQAGLAPALAQGEDRHRQPAVKLAVMLVGNYLPDGQESMQRFAAIMEKELAKAGVDVTLIRPEPFFGRLRSGTGGLGKWLGYLDKFFVFPGRLKRRIRKLREGREGRLVVHICDHSNAFYTRYLRDVPHLVNCHDLLAVRSALGEIPQNPTRWSGRILQRLVLRGLAGARAIACISEATRRDLSRLVKGSDALSCVVEMGLNAPFHPVPRAEALARVQALAHATGKPLPSDGRYLLHVGGDQWYKNRKGVVEIFCELRRSAAHADCWLVMVGKPLNAELKTLAEAAGLRERVVELPGVSHDDLCAIYSAAELLLFPSLQEGFGWPVIEAQACGCRVLTTGRPPMNNVGGDAAAYLVPENIFSSLDVLLNVLGENDEQRQARISRGFANVTKYSTAEMMAKYLALYEKILEGAS
jgi:glycosyltransferase involved in cell wall biosynthesis